MSASPLESDAERTEKLAARLEEIADELDEGGDREAAVGDVVRALRRYAVADGWFAKHSAIETAGTKFVSRTVAGQDCVALFRPDDPDELPAILRSGPSPIRDDEFAELVREAADDLVSLEREPAAVFEGLLLLLGNEPACLLQDHVQAGGKVYFKSRLAGVLGTVLVQATGDEDAGEA
ncbi:hypothetical protein [Halalkalicoccus sp. NIPERK01]|uniref:hypothetical protein n=1 Tax=Halalkalicoccus sp. NIPERK01 TaxID=3053469 RepID=UPI00256EBB20|nr:hypothetical protein [Halalkalicoccus sp. NIPERK01]MDL5363823.1 hypothetical protein [Halalkalicoccus sp. NIPERK01]